MLMHLHLPSSSQLPEAIHLPLPLHNLPLPLLEVHLLQRLLVDLAAPEKLSSPRVLLTESESLRSQLLLVL